MKTVVVVWPDAGVGAGATRAKPSSEAFEACFKRLGWHVVPTISHIEEPPDLIAGYGWRPVMRTAWERWPEIVLHTDLAFWGRHSHQKLALGGRWSPLSTEDFDASRLREFNIDICASRKPGRRILVCGMSAKAAGTWRLKPEAWEQEAIKRLRSAGAHVLYRPKPSWHDATRLDGATFDQRPLEVTLASVDAVVSHHSNCAVDALVAGLPIYVEDGIAKPFSVPTIEDAVGAEALDIHTRKRFLRQVAWHQWTLQELARGVWLEPPAPLAGHPLLLSG